MFDRIADRKIREAMAAGAFDDLGGAGQPLDLEAYFRTPEPLRMAHSILKNAGCLPEEVELLNRIAALERQVSAAPDAERRAEVARRLAEAKLRLRLRLRLERARRG